MPTYHIWNIGCQMNKAESERLGEHLSGLGWRSIGGPAGADLVVMNTCVVRGNAEERVEGELSFLKGLKSRNPRMAIAVTGCFVQPGEQGARASRARFPYVDFFFPAGEVEWFKEWLGTRNTPPSEREGCPAARAVAVAEFVPIMQGCNNCCSYCIVPYRRGRERSRAVGEILSEVEDLVSRGAKEVTLLGQNVNAYGRDSDGTGLAGLLSEVNRVSGLERLRFLTSHPRDVDSPFIHVLARLDKVCRWISLPVQAGDDRVLRVMRRGYSVSQYRSLVAELREGVPGISLSTDVIVGFPGETADEFESTVKLLAELRFDTVHVATYSPRPGTLAARNMPDDVPAAEKARRLQVVEDMQERIGTAINQALIGKTVQALVERRSKGKWEGRSQGNKLVFFSDEADWTGRLAEVEITSAAPWSLQGRLALKAGVGAR